MYYILVETEQPLVTWIDEMGDTSAGNAEEAAPSFTGEQLRLSSSHGVPTSLRSSTDGATSSCSSSLEIPHPNTTQVARSSAISASPVVMEEAPMATATSSTEEKRRSTYNVLEAMAGPSTPLPQIKKKLAFTTGNPLVETTTGIIHLYNEHPAGVVSAMKTSKMVCIVAVPTWLSLADLTDWFSDEFLKTMDGIRVLADSSPNKYMVVLKFRANSEAVSFVDEFHGKPFSTMTGEYDSPEVCHCAFVKYVDFIKPNGKSKQESIASSTLFPYSRLSGPTLIEIPNCPVCLERLDSSVSGLLTILCNHTFHCTCLMQWKEDTTCPVCRYTQQPTGHESLCAKCGTHEGLWICLLCGHVGCSRYQDSHAYTHYKDTLHNYALELSSQRVWDYAGDGYVHRLIQNKSDGKLVELPANHPHSSNARPEALEDKEGLQKADAIYLEYQYLLTAQLETQRSWFEQKMREHEEIRSRHIRELESQQKSLRDQLTKSVQRTKQLETDSDAFLAAQFEKDKQIRELEEQIRDLMVYLDARKAVAGEGELVDGQVVMLANPDARIAAATSSGVPSTPTRDALRRKLAKKANKK